MITVRCSVYIKLLIEATLAGTSEDRFTPLSCLNTTRRQLFTGLSHLTATGLCFYTEESDVFINNLNRCYQHIDMA